MKFLTKATMAALSPKKSVIAILKHNLSGYQKDRSHETVHASDVTKHDFCARQFCLMHETKETKDPQYLGTALAVTFDMGNMVSEYMRTKWLGQAAVGNWNCRRCGDRVEFASKPPLMGKAMELGGDLHEHLWEYEEVAFVDPVTGVSGSPDVLLNMGGLKMFVLEVKTMAPDQWEKIVAPLAEHRIRTTLYMHLVEAANNAFTPHINLQEAKVIYVSRAFGKKHPTYGEILPFKEFTVQRDNTVIESALAKGALVELYQQHKIMPVGICGSSADEKAMKCVVKKACFSGKYPAGQKCVSQG